MRVIKILDKFYRICSNGFCKDIFVDKKGVIQSPEYNVNILTKEEKSFASSFIKKDLKLI